MIKYFVDIDGKDLEVEIIRNYQPDSSKTEVKIIKTGFMVVVPDEAIKDIQVDDKNLFDELQKVQDKREEEEEGKEMPNFKETIERRVTPIERHVKEEIENQISLFDEVAHTLQTAAPADRLDIMDELDNKMHILNISFDAYFKADYMTEEFYTEYKKAYITTREKLIDGLKILYKKDIDLEEPAPETAEQAAPAEPTEWTHKPLLKKEITVNNLLIKVTLEQVKDNSISPIVDYRVEYRVINGKFTDDFTRPADHINILGSRVDTLGEALTEYIKGYTVENYTVIPE